MSDFSTAKKSKEMNNSKKYLAIILYSVLVIVVSSIITTVVIKSFYTLQPKAADQKNEIMQISAEQLAASPVRDNDRLIEVMSYGCHYCQNAEVNNKKLEKLLPDNIKITRIHLVADNALGKYAPVFATLQAMGLEESMLNNAYEAVVQKQIDLSVSEQLQQWLTNNGIDKKEYLRVSKTPAAQQILNYMRSITEYYKIQATPSYIVDKKWLVLQNSRDEKFNEDIINLLSDSGDHDG